MDEILTLLKRIYQKLDRSVSSPWLTLSQGAKYVQMDPQPFREMVYRGDVESYQRSKKRVFVNKDDLDELMRSYPSACRVPEALRGVL